MNHTPGHSMLSGILKNFKYFSRDPHRIVSYGLQVENKDSLKSYIDGQIFENFGAGDWTGDPKNHYWRSPIQVLTRLNAA